MVKPTVPISSFPQIVIFFTIVLLNTQSKVIPNNEADCFPLSDDQIFDKCLR